MQDVLPAAAAVLSGVAMLIGLLLLLKFNAFDRLIHKNMDEIVKHIDSQAGQKTAASEPIVLAISELARFMQSNQDALCALLRDERAALEPRLQHMYAYMEQTLTGVVSIYQVLSTSDRHDSAVNASPQEDAALMATLESVLQCLITMEQRLRDMAAQAAPAPCESSDLAPLLAAVERATAEHSLIEERLDGMVNGMSGIAALLERWNARRAEESTAASGVGERLDAIACGVTGISATLNQLNERMPEQGGDAYHAALEHVDVRLNDVSDSIAGVAFALERLDVNPAENVTRLPRAELNAFNDELARYSDVMSDSRRKLHKITRALNEANRRAETMQRRLAALSSKSAHADDQYGPRVL